MNFYNPANQQKYQGLDRQNEMARAMMMRSMQPQQGANAATAIGNILSAYFAKRGMDKTQGQMDSLKTQDRSDYSAELAKVMATPQQGPTISGDALPSLPNSRQEMLQAMMQSQYPQLQQMALQSAMTPASYQKLGTGDVLVNPANGQTVAQGNPKPDQDLDSILKRMQVNKMLDESEQKQVNIDLKKKELEEKEAQKEKQRGMARQGYELVSSLIDPENRKRTNKGFGKSSVFGYIPGTETGDVKKEIERVKNMLTAENLGLMSGVLSESDIKILASIGSTLDTSLTDEAGIAELERVQKIFADAMEGKSSKPESESKTIGNKTYIKVNGQWYEQ